MSACMPGQKAASEETKTLASAPVSMCTSTSQPYLCRAKHLKLWDPIASWHSHVRRCPSDQMPTVDGSGMRWVQTPQDRPTHRTC
jgi:hypothetical protein